MINLFNKDVFRNQFVSMIIIMSVFCTCVLAQNTSSKPIMNGWLMVFIITALLVGIAWMTMYQKGGRISMNGDQVLLDLDEKLQNGEISRQEYESRKRDLEL